MNPLARLTDHLESRTGIDMGRAGLGRALERYLDKRIPELGLPSREAYVDSLSDNPHELGLLIDVVTVSHSWFFRDAAQWRVVETLLERAASVHPLVRVWVPGCATGEDAYTMALIARRRGFAVQITASDINTGVLARARRGIYNAWAIRDVPAEYGGYFHARGEGHFELDEELRRSVAFTPHNLVEAPLQPREGGWDLILCRNVFIYIVRAQAVHTLRRLGQSLRAGGSLLLGASDLVYTLPPELAARYEDGRLVLQRLEGNEPRAGAFAHRRDPPPMLDRSGRRALVPRADVLAPIVPASSPPLVANAAAAASPLAAAAPPTAVSSPATTLVTEANRKLDEGDAASALLLYEKARSVDPLAPEAHFFAGVAHHSEGRFDEAVKRLRSSLFLDPALWPASLYLAFCYERLERKEDAFSEYQRVARAADEPFRFHAETTLGSDLQHWRREVVALAKRRAGHRR